MVRKIQSDPNLFSFQQVLLLTIHHSMMRQNTKTSVASLSYLLRPSVQVILNISYIKLGPAPKAEFDGEDVIDEAITQFRANIFFKNYEVRGPADKVIIYLTVFIQKCLEIIAKK